MRHIKIPCRIAKQSAKTVSQPFYISDCFLLSKSEYEGYKSNIPIISDCWWLRTRIDNFYAYSVSYDGSVYNNDYVNSAYVGVRPALKIENLSAEQIKIGNWVFSKIADKIYFADSVLFRDYFDRRSNEYCGSHIETLLQHDILPLLQTAEKEIIK